MEVRKELKAEIWNQKLNQRPWKNGAYYLLLVACLASYSTQDYEPWGGTTHSELDPHT